MQRTLMRPPSGRLGPVTEERKAIIAASPVNGQYEEEDDHAGAYENLGGERRGSGPASDEEWAGEFRIPKKPGASELPPPPPPRKESGKKGGGRQTYAEAFGKSLVRSLGTAAGRILDRVFRTKEITPCQTRRHSFIDWRRHPEERLTLAPRRLCLRFALHVMFRRK